MSVIKKILICSFAFLTTDDLIHHKLMELASDGDERLLLEPKVLKMVQITYEFFCTSVDEEKGNLMKANTHAWEIK